MTEPMPPYRQLANRRDDPTWAAAVEWLTALTSGEAVPGCLHVEHTDCILCAEGRSPADHNLGDS